MSKTTRVKMKDRGNRPNGLPTITTVFTRDSDNATTLRVEDGLLTEVEMTITRDFAVQLAAALVRHFEMRPSEMMVEMAAQGHENP